MAPDSRKASESLVVFVRGLNVGGHRRFRPAVLAGAEIARRLPFKAEIVMCDGREIMALLSTTVFDRYPRRADVVRFVSVLSQRSRVAPRLPLTLPLRGRRLLKVLAREGRFVLGMYRRHMKVIGYLGSLDGLFGVPATTRNWNTMTAVARVVTPT